jgi:hypothetical protein
MHALHLRVMTTERIHETTHYRYSLLHILIRSRAC